MSANFKLFPKKSPDFGSKPDLSNVAGTACVLHTPYELILENLNIGFKLCDVIRPWERLFKPTNLAPPLKQRLAQGHVPPPQIHSVSRPCPFPLSDSL